MLEPSLHDGINWISTPGSGSGRLPAEPLRLDLFQLHVDLDVIGLGILHGV